MQFEDVRFLSSICVLLTHFLGIHLLSAAAIRAGPIGQLVQPLVLVLLVSLQVWFNVFGQWMSRSRRAIFNEHNILLTYQPRALTHGHLFVPDPPTPARDDGQPIQAHGRLEPCTASEFRAARDAHYKDEALTAKKTTAERRFCPTDKIESMRIEFDESSSPSTASTTSAMTSPSPGHHI